MTEVQGIEITAKVQDGGEATIIYDFGTDLDEMVKKFDKQTAFTNARANMKIVAQAAMRRLIQAGKTQDEITSIMKSWKPGVTLERTVDPKAAILAQWKNYSPEEKAAFLAELKG